MCLIRAEVINSPAGTKKKKMYTCVYTYVYVGKRCVKAELRTNGLDCVGATVNSPCICICRGLFYKGRHGFFRRRAAALWLLAR